MARFAKVKENKFLKFIWNIFYWLLVIFTLLTLLLVVLQRTSNNSISLGGFRLFNVISGSMVPEYEIGEVLLSKEIKEDDIKIGDDVVYNGKEKDFAGKIVTHRVLDIALDDNGKKVFQTYGIANGKDNLDPPIGGEQIMGKVVWKVPILSHIAKLSQNLYSFYFIIFVPMALLIFLEVRKSILHFLKKDNLDVGAGVPDSRIEKEEKKE